MEVDPLRNYLCLPSNRTVRYVYIGFFLPKHTHTHVTLVIFAIFSLHYIFSCYKNKIDQKPGWNKETLKWCLEEATKAKLTDKDYWGALVLHEMKIQIREDNFCKIFKVSFDWTNQSFLNIFFLSI